MTEVFEGTPKDWAVSKGLANPGRGRMSVEATKAVEEAKAAGLTFTIEKRVTISTSRPAADPNDAAPVDPSAVRAWAASNGHQVAARGRMSAEVVSAYRKAVPVDARPVVTAAAPEATETADDTKSPSVQSANKRAAVTLGSGSKDLRPESPVVNAPGTKWVAEVNGKTVTSTLGEGRTVCMVSQHSISHCPGHNGDKHQVLFDNMTDPVYVTKA